MLWEVTKYIFYLEIYISLPKHWKISNVEVMPFWHDNFFL